MRDSKKILTFLSLILALLLLIFSLGGIIKIPNFYEGKESLSENIQERNEKTMKISSPAFINNSFIPEKYTCDGENVSPPIQFEDLPENTQSLVLIVDDPDAPGGTFDHWLIWNIDPLAKQLREAEKLTQLTEGLNDFGSIGYKGPCPPSGTHRYFFRLFALDSKLNLPQGSTREELEKEMQGKIIDQAVLIGLYQRKKI